MHQYFVYILSSQKHGTLYIGVTRDLARRVYQHKNKLVGGFTAKYGVDKLVYAGEYRYISEALLHEKTLKRWKRAWKIRLIEKYNPEWIDLYYYLL